MVQGLDQVVPGVQRLKLRVRGRRLEAAVQQGPGAADAEAQALARQHQHPHRRIAFGDAQGLDGGRARCGPQPWRPIARAQTQHADRAVIFGTKHRGLRFVARFQGA